MTNDEYGHDIGDKVLFLLGEILIQNIKGSDLACRYGGEEFIVLLVGATKQIAVKIAENIRLDFEKQNFSSNNESFHKTLSVGVATFKEDANNHWHTIKCADEALYYAKNHGRNKVVKFTQDMHTGKKELY
jgi:diguanylate cyclase (GGDEF)-like protein